MKKVYEEPEMTVIRFECEDIIMTSNDVPIVDGDIPETDEKLE